MAIEGLTPGRNVHYVAHGSADGKYPAGAHRAAIVTETYGESDTAGLCVLHPAGMQFVKSVPYDPTGQQPGTWHWIERA